MRTAFVVFVCGQLGCGGSAPVTPPKTEPVVTAESTSSLAVATTGRGAERAAPRSQGLTDSAQMDNTADAKEATDKEAGCVALIDEVNSTVEQLDSDVDAVPNATNILEPYKLMAKVMDEAHLKLSKVDFRDARLRDFAKEYQQMALDIANGARAVLEAAERRDVTNLEKALKDVEKSVKLEDPLVDAINEYCRAP